MNKLLKKLALGLAVLITVPVLGIALLNALSARVPAPGQMIDVGGYRLHIYCTGEDTGYPPVVIETGSGEPGALLHWYQQGLSDMTRVCSYDRAGLGWSEESGLPRDAKTVNEALNTLLTKAGVERPFVFLGHSVAGLYSRDYIERYPGEVSGLALLDPSHPNQSEAMNLDYEKFYPHLKAQIKALQNLIDFGLIEVYNPMEQGRDYGLYLQYPDNVREQLLFLQKQSKSYDAFLAEYRDFEVAAEQAASNQTLGDIPFAIVSAGTAQSAEGWPEEIDSEGITRILQALHTEMEDLSSKSRRHTVEGADHMSLILNREYAEEALPVVKETIRQALHYQNSEQSSQRK